MSSSRRVTTGFVQVLILAAIFSVFTGLAASVPAQENPGDETTAESPFVLEFSVARQQVLLYEPVVSTLTLRSTQGGNETTVLVSQEDYPLIHQSGVFGSRKGDEEFRGLGPFLPSYYMLDMYFDNSSTCTVPAFQTKWSFFSPWKLRTKMYPPDYVAPRPDSDRVGVFLFCVTCSTRGGGAKRVYRSNTVEVEVVMPTGQDAEAMDFLQERLRQEESPWDVGDFLTLTPKNEKDIQIAEDLLKQFPDSVYADYIRADRGLILLRNDETRAEGLALLKRAASYEGIPWLDENLAAFAVGRTEAEDLATAVRLFRLLYTRDPNGQHTLRAYHRIGFSLTDAKGGAAFRPSMTAEEILELYPDE